LRRSDLLEVLEKRLYLRLKVVLLLRLKPQNIVGLHEPHKLERVLVSPLPVLAEASVVPKKKRGVLE
jgi:hypothetical protein